MKNKQVEVTWVDAWSNSRDYFTKDSTAKQKPCVLIDCGWLISHTSGKNGGITLGTEFDPDDQTWRHVNHIPNGDRKSTRLNSSHIQKSRMPSSA